MAPDRHKKVALFRKSDGKNKPGKPKAVIVDEKVGWKSLPRRVESEIKREKPGVGRNGTQ